MPLVVVGLDKIQDFVESLPEFVQQSADKIMGDAAQQVLEKAKNLVPVRTGRLQRSLNVTRVDQCLYLVGSSLYYAGFVEYGTSRMRAQPYLRPAWDLTEPQLLNSVVSTIDRLRSAFLM
jgi:HK97 gp10 family phage protein